MSWPAWGPPDCLRHGVPRTSSQLARLLRRRRDGRRFAAALHAAFPVRDGWTTWLEGETLVCRCEEVPYREVRTAVDTLGATDTRSVKRLARPGMGWCQGRICGYPAACLAARLTGRSVAKADLLGLARRPLAQPVPLAMLAQTPHPGVATGAETGEMHGSPHPEVHPRQPGPEESGERTDAT